MIAAAATLSVRWRSQTTPSKSVVWRTPPALFLALDAWLFDRTQIKRAPIPLQCRGALGLWELPLNIIEQLLLQGFFT